MQTCTTDCCLQFCGFFVDFIHHKSSHPFKSFSSNLNKGFNSYLAELHNQKKDIVEEFSLKQMEVMWISSLILLPISN
jgi:hypothetical protein